MKNKASNIHRTNDRSIRDKAYLHIQRKIALRELQQGSAISELALAKELGISRTPVRPSHPPGMRRQSLAGGGNPEG